MPPKPTLKSLTRSKAPMTSEELDKVQRWLDDDWESHDECSREMRTLLQRLIWTAQR